MAARTETRRNALLTIAALSGLSHENMNRRGGWHFLDLGTRIERAIAIARFVRRLGDPADADVSSLDCLLDLADAQMAYRARTLAGPTRLNVVDLVLLDETHPRSVAFQVGEIAEHLRRLAVETPGNQAQPIQSVAEALVADLAEARPADFTDAAIRALEARLMAISDAITRRYLAGPLPPADPAPSDGSALPEPSHA